MTAPDDMDEIMRDINRQTIIEVIVIGLVIACMIAADCAGWLKGSGKAQVRIEAHVTIKPGGPPHDRP